MGLPWHSLAQSNPPNPLGASPAVLRLCPSPGWGQTEPPGRATWIHISHRQEHGMDKNFIPDAFHRFEKKTKPPPDFVVCRPDPPCTPGTSNRSEMLRPFISHCPINIPSLLSFLSPPTSQSSSRRIGKCQPEEDAGRLQEDLPRLRWDHFPQQQRRSTAPAGGKSHHTWD